MPSTPTHSHTSWSARLRPFVRSHAQYIVSGLLLLLAVVLLSVTVVLQVRSRHVAASFAGYPVNAVVSMGSVTTSVRSVTSVAGSGIFAAPAGKHYLVITLAVRNNSEKPIQVLPSTDTYIKDPSGHITFLTPYDLSQPFRAGELLPGEQIQGQLSFLVPSHTSEKLYIDAGWSGGVISFAVQG